MLTEVKWNNHPALGDLLLDFTNSSGQPYNTIILAGENGTGKTTILETLKDFLNLSSIEPFSHIKYEVNGEEFKITPSTTHASFGFHVRTKLSNNAASDINANANNNRDSIQEDIFDVRHYGCTYSKARSGFTTRPVISVTTQQLNDSKYEKDDNDDFTSIKQLLIDISSQDDAQAMKAFQAARSFEEFQPTTKMFRFTNAFNQFFSNNIVFDQIDRESKEELKILFKKNGKSIAIDSLSTGEKQIVFRGAHLLKNSTVLDGGIIFIDEPELSMHPKWQEKILQYYRDLFTEGDRQTAQIVIATHSEYVLRSALEDQANVLIIALKDSNGLISENKISQPFVLPSITAAEINYHIFGILSSDYHIQLYGHLQSLTNNNYIKDMDVYIASQSSYDAAKHHCPSSNKKTNYDTLSTYIRNIIDHPDNNSSYTAEQLKESTELLIDLCKAAIPAPQTTP